jgi:ParB-like chromosome segregation protein Spo0J
MRVDLRTLQSNPWRDFEIDPLEEEESEALLQSINDTGFWGGVPVRKKNGVLQIGAGHKRVYCAIKAGHTHADLVVKNFTDEEMIRMYATENATQRGTDMGLAMDGAVAGALRYIIEGVLKNDQTIGKYFPKVNGIESVRGAITSEKGLGWEVILRFFKDTPINSSIVKEHLAQLKASGHYARIVKEIHDKIAAEQKAERAELKRQEEEAAAKKLAAEAAAAKAAAAAEKAAKDKAEKEAAKKAKEEAAVAKRAAKEAEDALKKSETKKTKEASEKAVTSSAKKEPTFDLKGVGKWLKTQTLIRSFRNVMSMESIHKSVPVSRQADLAAWLVHRANTINNGKLTANFILVNLPDLIKGGTIKELKLSPTERAEIEHEAAQKEFTNLAHHFCRNLAGVMRDAKDMIDLKDEYSDLRFNVNQEFIDAVRLARPTVTKLATKFNIS